MSKLTKRLIDGLEPEAKDKVVWDSETKGFGLRVQPSGVKSFLIQYRNDAGRSRRMTLGRYGVLTPDEARKRAKIALCGPGMSVRARALWLRTLIHRYAGANWPRDRAADRMPSNYQGTEKEYLFRAFNICAPPSGERQLRAILSGAFDDEYWQKPGYSNCQPLV